MDAVLQIKIIQIVSKADSANSPTVSIATIDKYPQHYPYVVKKMEIILTQIKI